MASQAKEHNGFSDEELEKILSKAFDEIRRRVYAHMAKREKKLAKELKSKEKEKDKEKQVKKSMKRSSDYRRSSSSSEQ